MALLALGLTPRATVAAAAGAPTVPEKYLLEQVAAGKVADLSVAFPEDGTRVIRGGFLEELLTGSRTDCVIHRNGVSVEGAIVRELVELRHAEIACDTQLVRCRFEGGINFSRSIFNDGLSVAGSVFLGLANFSEMKVRRGFNLQSASFQRSADSAQLELAGVLQAGGAAFEDDQGTVTFNNLKAGNAVGFSNALFAGAVDFKFSRIAGDL